MIATDPRLTPRFAVGDIVTAIAFTDCFGHYWPARTGLTVARITVVDNSCSHVRLATVDADGWEAVEGSQRFFQRLP